MKGWSIMATIFFACLFSSVVMVMACNSLCVRLMKIELNDLYSHPYYAKCLCGGLASFWALLFIAVYLF